MKEILIISYFFSPCNLTASQRALGWVKYLHEFGYYPTIITRNWDVEINQESDISKQTGTILKHEVKDGYEVYYLPYKGNLKDKLYSKYRDRFSPIRRALSFMELAGQNFSKRFIPFANMYDLADKLVRENEYKAVIITGNPFVQFQFGYLLYKKYNIPWIADYRDDWGTDELRNKSTGLSQLIRKLESRSERKWVGTAYCITSVSPYYTKKISDFTGVNGMTIYNGFFEYEFDALASEKLYPEVTLTYNGTLYPSQNIEVFFEGFKMAVNKLKDESKLVHLYFPGLNFKPEQAERVKQLLIGYEEYYTITDRIPRDKVLEIQKKSHALLMFPHQNIKGIPSSKLYEYLGLKKPILICPSDDDILEKTILETHSGVVCNTIDQIANQIIQMVLNYEKFLSAFNFKNSAIYTREHQTQNLAKILDSITAQ